MAHRAAPDYTISVDLRRVIRDVQNAARQEARKGVGMDLNKLNEMMYDKLRSAMHRVNPRPNALQQRMIDQELERVRNGVQPADIFPGQQ